MKFGKQIQKRQLDIPEYAASFVNYKALKKLIKKLSATPTLGALGEAQPSTVAGAAVAPGDARSALKANRATFFFQLERELEKVNAFYLQKEAELKVRLKTLLDKKRVLQSRSHGVTRQSAKFATLEEGFQQFANDLNKLQQFVEANGTAFSKILKKWDKTSKSKTKELYLSRAVEVQPFFNATVISELSDQATTSLQELGAWAEGDSFQFAPGPDRVVTMQHFMGTDEGDADTVLMDTVLAGNVESLKDLLARMQAAAGAVGDAEDSLVERVTRTFLASINKGSREALGVLLATGLVDINSEDDINERNCLHQATIYGKPSVLEAGLAQGVASDRRDVYGRVPLHYASMHGRLEMLDALLGAECNTINLTDHDNYTPLVHAIIHGRLECVERLLEKSARLDPVSDADHVPLNLACEHGSVAIVESLLKHGARIVADAEGLYPQHLVARSSQPAQLLLLLQEYGADLDQVDRLYGWTPLVHAASEGNVAGLQALLDTGVDPDIPDEKDLTAIYYAALEGHLECMRLLTAYSSKRTKMAKTTATTTTTTTTTTTVGYLDTTATPMSLSQDADAIPVLELPPPIIPLRRYGHNFLDTKTVVQLTFEDDGEPPLVFFQDGKYPAARLTISSKTSDLIPKNVILPFQEDTRLVSFQVDNLDSFTLDLDVFPTYGAKVIAKTVALPSTFKGAQPNNGGTGSGACCLPLFDPRLRAIGQIRFHTQVIRPFGGKPLEITDFETYWKATSQLDRNPSSIVTGSSLSGDFVRLWVQYTSDGAPVLWPDWTVACGGLRIPVCRLTAQQFEAIAAGSPARAELAGLAGLPEPLADRIPDVHRVLATAGISLDDALSRLPPGMHANLQVLYPTAGEEQTLGLGPCLDVNAFADAILTVVFNHARAQRAQAPHAVRNVVFSSFSPALCTALNWKQPNFPVFLCNDLGGEDDDNDDQNGGSHGNGGNGDPTGALNLNLDGAPWGPRRRGAAGSCRSGSIKEAIRVAQSNNLMGLICNGRLLDMVPMLVDSIKSHSLALVTDKSAEGSVATAAAANDAELFRRPSKGIDGVLRGQGVLRFNESIHIQ